MSSSHKLSLRGPGALRVSATDDQQTTTHVEGTANVANVHASGDVVVHDELHAHDPCSVARDVPALSRFVVKRADTDTVFFLPERSEFVLPALDSQTPPLHFEFVGSNLKHFVADAGETRFHGTSYVLAERGSMTALRRPSAGDDVAFELKNTVTQALRLTVRTVRDSARNVLSYRLTGSVRVTCACVDCTCNPCPCDPCTCDGSSGTVQSARADSCACAPCGC